MENNKPQRSTGINIISIIIGADIFLTLLSAFTDLQINYLLALFDFIVIILGSMALFGFWNLEKWGWDFTIGYAAFGIIGNVLYYFLFIDLILKSVQSSGIDPTTYNRSTIEIGIIFNIIIYSIILIYVYSKKEFFTTL